MEVIFFILTWYIVGLFASYLIISKGKYFNWGVDWPLGLVMAIFGPCNFVGLFAVTSK